MTLALADYPNEIASAELAHLKAQQVVRDLSKDLEARKAQFGAIVADDKELSNDAKRKAARAELELTDPEYLDLQAKLVAAKDAMSGAAIEVERVSNAFKVERLLTELKIAVMSVQG